MLNAAGKARAEVVSNSRNKIHQTWGPPFRRALYKAKAVVGSKFVIRSTINVKVLWVGSSNFRKQSFDKDKKIIILCGEKFKI